MLKNSLFTVNIMEGHLPPLVPYVRLKIRLDENRSPCKELVPRFVTDFFFNLMIKPYLEIVGVSDEEKTKIEETWLQALKRVIERNDMEFLRIPKGFIHLGKERHVTWGPNFYFEDWYFVATLYLPFDEETLEKYFDSAAKNIRQTYLPGSYLKQISYPGSCFPCNTVQDLLATCGEADVSIKLCNEELASIWLSTKVHSILPPHKDP
jgi:hypothetical protein